MNNENRKNKKLFIALIACAAAAAIVRLALHSRAKLAVIPVQDILLLGSDARMNTPSTVGCNWEFRLKRLPKREKLQILRI